MSNFPTKIDSAPIQGGIDQAIIAIEEYIGISGPSGTRTASTATGGVALANGTPTFASLTTPNDGNLHTVDVAATVTVSSLETGGAVQASWTIGGVAQTSALFAGGQAAGTTSAHVTVVADPNTAVVLSQSSALTGGAATIRGQVAAIS